jgi:Kef-type K+ transport system membrane component KefB
LVRKSSLSFDELEESFFAAEVFLFTHITSQMDLLLFLGIGVLFGFAISLVVSSIKLPFLGFKLPSVVGYIIAGIILSPSLLGVFHHDMVNRMDYLSDLTLALVAFIIGSSLRWEEMAKVGKKVFVILISESMGAFIFVFLGVWLIKGDLALALIFASMAPATAPAGTVVVLRETKSKGILTNTLLAIVGLDDGFAIIIYAFAIAMAKLLISKETAVDTVSLNWYKMIVVPLFEILGSIILGGILGLLLALFVRKTANRDHVLIMSLGMLLICSGLTHYFHFSLILADMALAMVIANVFPRESYRSLQGIQGLTPPLFVIFFVLAGAHMKLSLIGKIGVIGLAYFIMRMVGKLIGSYGGCAVSKAPDVLRKYLGMALFSQAGVAIGLALIAQAEFRGYVRFGEDLGTLVINTIAGTTLLFEILGPITVTMAVNRAGESGKA